MRSPSGWTSSCPYTHPATPQATSTTMRVVSGRRRKDPVSRSPPGRSTCRPPRRLSRRRARGVAPERKAREESCRNAPRWSERDCDEAGSGARANPALRTAPDRPLLCGRKRGVITRRICPERRLFVAATSACPGLSPTRTCSQIIVEAREHYVTDRPQSRVHRQGMRDRRLLGAPQHL